jgi:hypothetical protein
MRRRAADFYEVTRTRMIGTAFAFSKEPFATMR